MKFLSDFKEKLKSEKKLFILVILGLLGILLIFGSEFIKSPAKTDTQQQETDTQSDYCDTLEEKLKSVLSKTEGAGRVEVMITLQSSDEKIYATDEKTNYKSSDSVTERTYDEQYVLSDGNSDDGGIVLKTNAPEIKGVIVVCDGGDNSAVANQITNAVCASLGIQSNCVSVLKMKSREE